ncbi:hypothetical protein [uncultured Psychroserpens sp.]|uniref:hypothetical protein n=1 Tax=uncultured Psychroserpens sp. TaxID=255436 RepID=UPI002634C46D|nr:hypothetical protein [uncultured Psychroserpens sp.]
MPHKNTITLVFSGLIFAGFFVSGVLDILDYFIVKAILFSAFAFLAVHLILIVLKDSENKNHLK